jgi:hypothetical protein
MNKKRRKSFNYQWIIDLLIKNFPNCEIRFDKKHYDLMFCFGIMKYNVNKCYSVRYLCKKRAYKPILRVIKRWKKYFKVPE